MPIDVFVGAVPEVIYIIPRVGQLVLYAVFWVFLLFWVSIVLFVSFTLEWLNRLRHLLVAPHQYMVGYGELKRLCGA